MNNWRLLLLAVVVVVQPYGSFTESNLIDGRECCERSEDVRLYGYRKTDERRLLDGNREDHRTAHEERRLRSDVRDERRHETYRGPMLTRSESLQRNERRLSSKLGRSTEHRLVGGQERRSRDTFARNREARKDQHRNRDESRNILDQNERDSRESRNRDELDASRIIRLSRDGRDTSSVKRGSRNTMSRLPIRTLGSNEERRITENRERSTLKRENVVRSDIRRDLKLSASARSESRLQLDDNRERRVFNRRTEEEGTEFRRSRFSDATINEVRAIRAQRSIEQNERNNRDFRDMRAEVRKDDRESELRDRISAVRRDSERYSNDRARESKLVGDRIEGRRQQRDENRRFIDTLRNTVDKRLDFREIKASRNVDDMKIGNAVRMEQRSISLDRLSMLRENRDNRLLKSSEKITRNERVTRIRDARDETSDERREERNSNRLSRISTKPMQETRRTVTRNNMRDPSEKRREREIKDSVGLEQESRIVTRRGVRKSSEERRQQRAVSRLSRDRTTSVDETRESEASRRNIMERPEERRLQNSRASRSMSSLPVVRDNTELESRKNARGSSEQRDRENNSARGRVSILREKREVRDSYEGTQEARRIVRYNVRSDLRRDVLDRSMHRARMTRIENDERANYARKLSRARSANSLRTRDDTRVNGIERQQTRSQDRSLERASRRSTRMETIQLERIVRNRIEARPTEYDRQNMQRDGRTLSNRQSSERFADSRQENRESVKDLIEVRLARTRKVVRDERVLAERRQDSRETVKDSREVLTAKNRDEVRSERLSERRQENRDSTKDRTARNRDEVRSERVLAERKQDSRETVKDSREVRTARNRDEVRSETVLAERKQDNREIVKDSREVRMEKNRDEVRRERVLAERKQDNREIVKDSREVRTARNRDEVRSERVLAERKQDNRETVKDSREVRMEKNRDEVRRERVLAERKQDNREIVKDSREVRTARNRDEVRSVRVLAERKQDNRETVRDSREVRMEKNRDKVRGERVLAERKQDNRETVKDSREVRTARNRAEVRSERFLAERRQDNHDAARHSIILREARNRDLSGSERTVRSVPEKMAERSDSRRQRDIDFRSLQREAYVNELNERSRDSDARSNERQMQMSNLRTNIRETKSDVRRNNDFEGMNSEREGRRVSLRSDMNYQDTYVQEDEFVFSNWQMVFYTLQGVYLCGLLVQMLNENANKKKRSFNWWSFAKNLIKVD